MKKKFETPELIIIKFADQDIIVTSSEYDEMTETGDLDQN